MSSVPQSSANPCQVSSPCQQISFSERSTIVSPIHEVLMDDFPHWRLVDADIERLVTVPQEPVLTPEVKYSICFISEDNARRLRERLNSVTKARLSCSDALGAFLWMHVLRARNIDTKKYPKAKLSICVDARSRMTDQVVAPTYWGNFCEPNAVATLPTSFLCGENHAATEAPASSGEAPQAVDWNTRLPKAVLQVRAAIAAVDNTAVRRLVGILNHMPKATSLTWNVDRWPGPDMLIVGLNHMPFNNSYYGPELGTSEAARITIGTERGKPDGRCLLLPPRKRDGKGIEIALYYDVDTLERLRQSCAFGEFVEWRN